jgi:hypothetical protein
MVLPGYVAIGTKLLGRPYTPGATAAEPLSSEPLSSEPSSTEQASTEPGSDGTLLAVVPIPGTGTSLAIVGYAITTPGEPQRGPAAAAPAPKTRSGLLIDDRRRQVWADGSEIVLTFLEFELLAFLSAHPATVFSRADLVERVWQDRSVAFHSRTVDVHVSRLRHKLGPVYGQYLVTEYRVGYQFRLPA